MDLTALFGIIHESYCTIQLTFTFIYSTFNKKFSISAKYKQSSFQTNTRTYKDS